MYVVIKLIFVLRSMTNKILHYYGRYWLIVLKSVHKVSIMSQWSRTKLVWDDDRCGDWSLQRLVHLHQRSRLQWWTFRQLLVQFAILSSLETLSILCEDGKPQNKFHTKPRDNGKISRLWIAVSWSFRSWKNVFPTKCDMPIVLDVRIFGYPPFENQEVCNTWNTSTTKRWKNRDKMTQWNKTTAKTHFEKLEANYCSTYYIKDELKTYVTYITCKQIFSQM